MASKMPARLRPAAALRLTTAAICLRARSLQALMFQGDASGGQSCPPIGSGNGNPRAWGSPASSSRRSLDPGHQPARKPRREPSAQGDALHRLSACETSMNTPLDRMTPSRKATTDKTTRGSLSAFAALWPLAAGYFLSYLFRNVNSVVATDIMRDLGVGADALGLLTSVYFLTFAAAQLPVGVLLDRHGPRRVQCVLLLCAAAGAGLCALNAGFTALLLGRALIGLGTAGSLVAGLKASRNGSRLSAGDSQRRLHHVRRPWRVGGNLAGRVPPALGGLAWVVCHPGRRRLVVALAVRGFVPVGRRRQAPDEEEVRLADVVRDPLFRRFAPLSASCFGSVLAVQGLWAGPWLTDVDGLSRPEVANGLACMAMVLIVAAPCWGVLTQRLRQRMKLARVAAGRGPGVDRGGGAHAGARRFAAVLTWSLFAVFGGMTVLSYQRARGSFPVRQPSAAQMVHSTCCISAAHSQSNSVSAR